MILLCLLLSGCASKPQVFHVTWIKDDTRVSYAEKVTADTCMIVTRQDKVGFAEFGALFRKCLK